MSDDGVEQVTGEQPREQAEEPPRRPRYLAEIEDEDGRARTRGHLLTLLTGGLPGS